MILFPIPANTFVLQVQASQVDNPLKTALARVEVEVLDLNDNLPEFEVDFYNISIVENLPNGELLSYLYVCNGYTEGSAMGFLNPLKEGFVLFNTLCSFVLSFVERR